MCAISIVQGFGNAKLIELRVVVVAAWFCCCCIEFFDVLTKAIQKGAVFHYFDFNFFVRVITMDAGKQWAANQ